MGGKFGAVVAAIFLAGTAGLAPAQLAFATGNATSKASEAGAGRNSSAGWTRKMRELEAVLQEILADASSDERFNSPSSLKRVRKNAEKLARLAHQLKSGKGNVSPDSDPSVQIIAGEFAREASHAVTTLQSGQRSYARSVLRSLSGYCIACHTRNGSGPSFSTGLQPAAQALKGLEKANFLASTRQFDSALEEYERIVAEPSGPEVRALDWERAIRSGLAIAVRVKKDPERALRIVERALTSSVAPFFLKEQALKWKDSLLAWQTEPVAKAQTEEGYHALVVRLIGEARGMQKYPADRSADILYLRATAAVHDLMSFAPHGKYATESLFLAGAAYEVLRDLNLWDMHEFYYLACIMKEPRTPLARQCFKHYEQSVYLGYTGSGGSQLPRDVRDKLNELDLLSRPAEVVPVKR